MPAFVSAGPTIPGPVILTTTERWRSRSMPVTRRASIPSAPPVSRPVIKWTIVAIVAQGRSNSGARDRVWRDLCQFQQPMLQWYEGKIRERSAAGYRVKRPIPVMRHRTGARHLLDRHRPTCKSNHIVGDLAKARDRACRDVQRPNRAAVDDAAASSATSSISTWSRLSSPLPNSLIGSFARASRQKRLGP